MGIALLNLFGRRRETETTAEAQAIATLNLRMQRMLELHLKANVKTQDLPRAQKAS